MMKLVCILILIYFQLLTIYSQLQRNCVNFIPKSKEECHVFNTPATYCCFVSNGLNNFINHCQEINPAEYLTSNNWTIFSNINMTVDCGNVYSERNYPSCGNSTILSTDDCKNFSTETSSCCYYSYFGKKGCIAYKKVDQSTVLGNVVLQCHATFIKTIFYIHIQLLLFVFF
jgi:hypothetical protein